MRTKAEMALQGDGEKRRKMKIISKKKPKVHFCGDG
jgi:hypothetical protein